MNAAFWAERWKQGRIGFHEGAPNSFLQTHHGELGGGRSVLVPLCGKSEDLAFLAQLGHRVVGVEIVRRAVSSFFEEHKLEPQVSRRGAFEVFEAGSVTLLVGDIFDLTPADTGPLDALYDRAAIIALPEDVRVRYVGHLRGLLPAQSRGLVITLEYPQAQMEGPPFSVPESELRQHYAGLEVDLLEERPWISNRGSDPEASGRQCCFRVRFQP